MALSYLINSSNQRGNMTKKSDIAQMARLTDLDLRIGQNLQLISHGPQPRKYYTRLIGFVEREFIMLRVPLENGWPVPFLEGQSFDVRVFCGVSLFEFQTHLQALLLSPRNYMLLSCPSSIDQMRLRSHERVKCALPVKILQASIDPSACVGFEIHDLSGSGAALVGTTALGEVGQRVQFEISFHLMATDTQEQLEIQADIQSVQPLRNPSGQITGYHHGLHFSVVEPRILLLVNELQRPQKV